MKKTYTGPMIKVKEFTRISMLEASSGLDGVDAAETALNPGKDVNYADKMSLKDSHLIIGI